MKNTFYIIFLIIIILVSACRSNNNNYNNPDEIQGDYFGQIPPSDSAKLFAPNTISTGMNERDFVISPDGTEIFFCREAGNFKYTTIFYTQRINHIWTFPEVFEYCTNPNYKFVEPHLSIDGKRLYFISNMPVDSSSFGNEDIWVSTKTDGKWSKPANLGSPVNTKSKEFFPSLTQDGTIYYTHLDTLVNDEFIYRSRFVNGEYQQPEKLGPNVNIGSARYNAFISSDESYVIIPAYGMPDSYGGTDYYISFRDFQDNWSQPINMGLKINTSSPKEWSASVSTDGKYIFLMSARMNNKGIDKLSQQSLLEFHNSPQNGNTDIYWISSSIIEELRLQADFKNKNNKLLFE
ncbi:MAG: hypothetical protein A2W99_07375 [Bacteroidetes bacterium GWF2_33_16]|nr:MAG: hypothetical protein A2X00_10325 [Bacteroidetes bacterium GWE2_32_14]OFY03029.1 MAG: hypothetical protein A2W99_07375 [Bacteroidetes bacterium GWF2_33_16]